MTTLQQVADKAGVSTATVSKVLSKTPYVSEDTEKKVLQAIEDVGYVPNLAARALSNGKTHIIAVVFPWVFDAIFSDPLVQHILEGVESVCRSEDYNILLSTPRNAVDKQYQQLIRSGYVDGVVALDNVPNFPVLDIARQAKLPAVAIGHSDHYYTIRTNDAQGGQLLMQHILDLGHRSVGIISTPATLNFSIHKRLQGLEDTCATYDVDMTTFPMALGDFSVESGYRCAKDLLSNHPQLTALVCLNDRMALGAMRYAQETGYNIPTDLSVVGYDDIALSQYADPPLTTISQQPQYMGQRAAQMLFALFNDSQPTSSVLSVRLVKRQSTASPRS